MQRIPIQNSELLSVGYDAELQILEIEFSDHSVYQLVSVAADVYAALMNSEDKKAYFEKFIRWEFTGQRVSP